MGITLESIKKKVVGNKFGKLFIKSYLGRSETGDNLWRCICDCGTEVIGRTANVTKENSGCRKCKQSDGPRAQYLRTYLLGKTFGRLTVEEYDGVTDHHAGRWKCRCSCGNTISTRSSHLITGKTQSCGCYGRERASVANTTHGLHDHPLYAVWFAMKQRCYNPKNEFFHRYGGRGIRVCDAWLESFSIFYNWATDNGYQDGLTIERIDNDGNYEPGNCRWATFIEQQQNRSRTRASATSVKKIRDDERPNHIIAKEYGMSESAVSRIKRGRTWSNI